MHGKAKLPVSGAEGPHGGHRMAMIGDPRARASWSFAVQEFAKAHHFSPRGGLSFGPPLPTLPAIPSI